MTSTKFQTSTNAQNTKFSNGNVLGLDIGTWKLFGI
jgi:hypothetical protein